ncbi:MAG: bifunctional 4-hydroxy-2-oxoglutarate aldolase/2-dehydro-3-deoxy-phosphogluconate aldolase, partial [Paludibacter sp.]
MKFSKIQVLSAMQATGMVPVFYHSDLEISKQVVKACY